jgi:hypothetical protein
VILAQALLIWQSAAGHANTFRGQASERGAGSDDQAAAHPASRLPAALRQAALASIASCGSPRKVSAMACVEVGVQLAEVYYVREFRPHLLADADRTSDH